MKPQNVANVSIRQKLSRETGAGVAQRPLTVLQLSRWLINNGGGGIQTYLATFPEILDSRDISLRYAALLPGTQPDYLSVPARLGDPGLSKFGNAKSLWWWLKAELPNIDVVHIHGATDWHFVVGALASIYKGVPYLVRPAGGLCPESLSLTRKRWIISRFYLKLCGIPLLRKAYAVIASSTREAALLQEIDSRLTIRTIPHGVALPTSVALMPPHDTVVLRIVFVGSIEPIKSLPTALRALSRLKAAEIDARLDIVGKGRTDYVDELMDLSKELGISDNVFWHGYQTGQRKRDLLRQSHVLVLPSLSENFGYAAAEAMAEGLPVVVSDGVGIAEQVHRYRTGKTFPVCGEQALVDALKVFLDPEEVRAYGKRAYLCAKNEFSKESMGRAILGIYREAVDSKENVIAGHLGPGDR